MNVPAPNVTDTALIFEGGGMRASYTAGAVVALLENNINFGAVYGISAGSSHTINYLSRDTERAKISFVDLVKDPNFGGVKSMLRGTGFFNGPYLYEGAILKFAGSDNPFAFDAETFANNPAEAHIEALDWDTGTTTTWTRKDMTDPYTMAQCVRASSTMPIFMPPTTIDGHTYVDGGLGDSWGILLHAAMNDGFKRFFIVRTQEKGYRKKPMGKAAQTLFKAAFRKHPVVAQRTIDRWQHYNALLDEIEALEAKGCAYVFYPEHMDVSNRTTDYDKLQASFEAGLAQARREVPEWKRWLEV